MRQVFVLLNIEPSLILLTSHRKIILFSVNCLDKSGLAMEVELQPNKNKS
jgi:hypothetical protein